MEAIEFQAAVDLALDSILAGRLALLAGAGLSMSSPSCLPDAATLAARAKEKYSATYGATRPPLPDHIGDQAQFFFERGELATVYLTRYIDAHVFSAPSNDGHAAVADLLLSDALRMAVTTNVDPMIESAGHSLFGRIGVGIDGLEMAAQAAAPLLKIHGCWFRDYANTVWAEGQLAEEPVRGRIERGSAWLAQQLLNRDLLIIGFSTDWDYLNALLSETLGAVNPARVMIVNPSESVALQDAAPALIEVGDRAENGFHHVRTTGDEFLNALRLAFSKSFMRMALSQGAHGFEHLKGHAADEADLEPPDLTNEEYWIVRRDLLGCRPGEPACSREPTADAMLALLILLLRADGAAAEGPYWRLKGQTIRVLRSSPEFLHVVQRDYERETGPISAPDVVVVAGAEPSGLQPNIARAPTGTMVRGANTKWLTRAQAIEELDL